jgi:hypothetical protein
LLNIQMVPQGGGAQKFESRTFIFFALQADGRKI